MIENNTCEVSSRALVYANSVENLIIRNNIISYFKDYPLSDSKANVLEFVNSKDVKMKIMIISGIERLMWFTNVSLKGNNGIEKLN